jgi:hypothetical protein
VFDYARTNIPRQHNVAELKDVHRPVSFSATFAPNWPDHPAYFGPLLSPVFLKCQYLSPNHGKGTLFGGSSNAHKGMTHDL